MNTILFPPPLRPISFVTTVLVHFKAAKYCRAGAGAAGAGVNKYKNKKYC